MDELLAYMRENPVYFLATVDADGNPKVRPFGTFAKFEDALYIQTGRSKDVYAQLKAHPHAAISGFNGKGAWLRLEADFVEDERVEAEAGVLDQYPDLKAMYAAGDGNCCVFKLEGISAYIDSFVEPRKILI